MQKPTFQQLLDAGVHFGHLKRKWNPAMAPYIFMERNGIHIIDLHKTIAKLDEAAAAMKQVAKSGRSILFVATKKQAKEIIATKVAEVGMPYITERWWGGMLTNFQTLRRAIKKINTIDKMETNGTFEKLSKRERLQLTREKDKLNKRLGSVADMTKLPAAVFVIDVMKEKIAIKEAQKLFMPIFAMVDTNSNPKGIDYVIPSNDDASQSIELILDVITKAIKEGLDERKAERVDKDKQKEVKKTKAPIKKQAEAEVEEVKTEEKNNSVEE
ncbi:MAG: 30S ribosomal protein S2 [Bacteroidales bacterium]|nr:30S ribosomal protein S2 [Bacteroidales bacterium]